MAERLRPVSLQCHVKVKEDRVLIFSGFAKHLQAESELEARQWLPNVEYPAQSTITCQQYTTLSHFFDFF
jgi:hypothetical protein